MRRRRIAGFTLMEVMIATAILALGLSTVFGSSVIAARGTSHARMVSLATQLARCRVTEVEAWLRTNQLPELDRTLDDPPESGYQICCEAPFNCTARVDRIELPQPTDVSTAVGDRLLGRAAGAARGTTYGPSSSGDAGLSRSGGGSSSSSSGGPSIAGGGAMAALAGAFGSLGGAGDPTGGLASSLAAGATGSAPPSGGGGSGSLSGAGAPSLQGMAMELISGVYPVLKPLLEGAIRMVTVTIAWNEGSREYHFDVVEYVTNPGQTIATGEALSGAAGPAGATPPGQTPTAPGTTPATTPPTTPGLPVPGQTPAP